MKLKSVYASVMSFMAVATMVAGCDADFDYQNDLEVESQQLPGYYRNDRLWEKDEIVVCFRTGLIDVDGDGVQETLNATPADKVRVRSLVENSWNIVSPVDFVGWQDCTSGDGRDFNIRMDSRYTAGSVYASGTGIQGHHMNMVTSTSAWGTNTVLHEFGHALGLIHEHARPDSLCTDYETSDGENFSTHGAYDPDSVMHYTCAGTTPVFATSLSDGDIATVCEMYDVDSCPIVYGQEISIESNVADLLSAESTNLVANWSYGGTTASWTILNPNDLSSANFVEYGDTVVLQNKETGKFLYRGSSIASAVSLGGFNSKAKWKLLGSNSNCSNGSLIYTDNTDCHTYIESIYNGKHLKAKNGGSRVVVYSGLGSSAYWTILNEQKFFIPFP